LLLHGEVFRQGPDQKRGLRSASICPLARPSALTHSAALRPCAARSLGTRARARRRPQRWPARLRAPRQAPREVEARACEALADLRARKLLSFRAPAGGGAPAWAASERGRAVYESALPTRLGERLYEVRRHRARGRGRAPLRAAWRGRMRADAAAHA